MRLRSTGFGDNRELKGDLTDLSPVGEDLLVMKIGTTEPVQWELKTGIEFQDIPMMLKAFIRPSAMLWIIRGLIWPKRDPKEPEEF
jgi:hypothetical protein